SHLRNTGTPATSDRKCELSSGVTLATRETLSRASSNSDSVGPAVPPLNWDSVIAGPSLRRRKHGRRDARGIRSPLSPGNVEHQRVGGGDQRHREKSTRHASDVAARRHRQNDGYRVDLDRAAHDQRL